MKQGQKRKLVPKDKHLTASWKKRDDARKAKQEAHAANLLLAATDADTLDYAFGAITLTPEQQTELETMLTAIPKVAE
jgi:hypothetical protein